MSLFYHYNIQQVGLPTHQQLVLTTLHMNQNQLVLFSSNKITDSYINLGIEYLNQHAADKSFSI